MLFRAMAFLSHRLGPPTETVPVERARLGMRKSMKTSAFVVGRRAVLASVSDSKVADVPVRRFVPAAAKPGALVFFHGGGWVQGDVETHDVVCSHLAAATQREVVSVEYRLAPEHRYPAAAEDCVAVTRALAATGKVVVAGDSAGGNLAAVVSLELPRDVTAQVLVYPVLDCAAETPSYAHYAEGHLLTRETMRYFRREYVPDEAKRSEVKCSPLRADSLRGQPPTYVLLAQCDVLHDEGVAYAKKLERDGVEVVLDDVPGTIHGFFSLQGLGPSKAALARVAQWLSPRW
jgi:acetyl esterase